ncbi:MAG: DUF4136 domain-containing protein [Cytophagales bacterium]|nr:DUF4136 domain-containing protein [Cytophagales bacterium]
MDRLALPMAFLPTIVVNTYAAESYEIYASFEQALFDLGKLRTFKIDFSGIDASNEHRYAKVIERTVRFEMDFLGIQEDPGQADLLIRYEVYEDEEMTELILYLAEPSGHHRLWNGAAHLRVQNRRETPKVLKDAIVHLFMKFEEHLRGQGLLPNELLAS